VASVAAAPSRLAALLVAYVHERQRHLRWVQAMVAGDVHVGRRDRLGQLPVVARETATPMVEPAIAAPDVGEVHENDLETKSALESFLGKSLAEAEAMFAKNALYYLVARA
jgi:hypothetical protein